MEALGLHCFYLKCTEGSMAVAANKRSVMTFSQVFDMYSHQVRIVLAEKGGS